MYVERQEITRILANEELTLEDIKTVVRGVRYERGYDERFDYANTLLSEAGDYLPPHTLAALVRADITGEDARLDLERNKAFFSRLVHLLPSIVRFFDEGARSANSWGIISIGRLKPEQFEMLDEQISDGKSLAAREIELGQARRAAGPKIDI